MPSQPDSSPLHALAESLRELRQGLEEIARAADVDALDGAFAAFARIARSLPCGPPTEARRQLAEPALAWLSRTGKATDAGEAVIWSAAGAIVQTQRFASLTGPVRLYENRSEASAAWNAQQEVMRNAFHHEQQLLDLAASVQPHAAPASEAKQGEGETPGGAVIVSLGNRQYRVGSHPPVVVSENEDTVLQAFLEQANMDTADLIERSGVGRAARVLSDLASKYGGAFAPAIRRPGAKGKGGYFVSIQAAGNKLAE